MSLIVYPYRRNHIDGELIEIEDAIDLGFDNFFIGKPQFNFFD